MTTVISIDRVDLALHPGVNFVAAETNARQMAMEHQPGFQALVAWWDDDRRLGSPADARTKHDYSAVARFAQGQSATLRVHVNRGQYEFFYKRSGAPPPQPNPSQSEQGR